MSTPGVNPPQTPAPATVGNQPTETVSVVHRLLTDLRSALGGLNGDIQQELLRLHDAMRAAMDRMFLVTHAPSTVTTTVPPTPQVAEPGSEAHAEGLKAAAEAQTQAAQDAQEQAQQHQAEQATPVDHAVGTQQERAPEPVQAEHQA